MAKFDSAARGDVVLVTGATGLLGSHLAERLLAEGYRVRAWLAGEAGPNSWTRLALR